MFSMLIIVITNHWILYKGAFNAIIKQKSFVILQILKFYLK